jgi:single-strand DNA-binding protein
MGYVNKVIIVGNVGADPELKQTTAGRPVCNLRVATNHVYKDKEGQRQERTEWHRVTVWGDIAEQCNRYVKKGSSVYVEGRLEHRSRDDADGKKRWTTDIIANRVVFLSPAHRRSEPGLAAA